MVLTICKTNFAACSIGATLSGIFAASLYNCWAALALEIFTLIMWLVSFAILASYSANFGLYYYSDYYYNIYYIY